MDDDKELTLSEGKEYALKEIATWIEHCELQQDDYSVLWRTLSNLRRNQWQSVSQESSGSEEFNIDMLGQMDVLKSERDRNRIGALSELCTLMAHFESIKDNCVFVWRVLASQRSTRTISQLWRKGTESQWNTQATPSATTDSTVIEITGQRAKPRRMPKREITADCRTSVQEKRRRFASQLKIVKPRPKGDRTTVDAGPITRSCSKAKSNRDEFVRQAGIMKPRSKKSRNTFNAQPTTRPPSKTFEL